MNRHWTDDQLLDRMYGLTDGDEHLASCLECASRWRALEARRALIATEAEVPSSELAAQRNRIYRRLERSPRNSMKWVPAVAAAAVVIAGVFFYNPRPPAPRADPGDAQLFTDLYSMEQAAEPRAAAPIRALFEEPVSVPE